MAKLFVKVVIPDALVAILVLAVVIPVALVAIAASVVAVHVFTTGSPTGNSI